MTMKKPTQFSKKPQVFDIDAAPGHGLLEYQFPTAGHVFKKDGRTAARTWNKIVSMTRKAVKEDTATDRVDGDAGVPSKSAAGTTVDDDEVTGKTADDTGADVAKPSKKRKINKTKQGAQGGNYQLLACSKCDGNFRYFVPAGNAREATIKSSTPCTCPKKEAIMPSTETIYDDPEEIIGELILYITEAYDDFVVDFRTTGSDGTRTNSSKKKTSLFTRQRRLFEITMAIVAKRKFKFHSLLENTPTINTDEDDPNLCKICGLPPTDNFQYQIECDCCTSKPLLCSSCLSNMSRHRDRFTPLQFTESSNSPVVFKAGCFAVVNSNLAKCYYCKSEVQKCRPISGQNVAQVPLDIPTPYGWIGDLPCMSEADYTRAHKAFEHFLQPYTKIYNQLLLPLLKVTEMVSDKDKDHHSLGSCTMNIKTLQKLLEDLVLHCETRMYKSVPWVQHSSSMMSVPTVDENSDPVNPLADFDPKKQKQIEYVLKNMHMWGLETLDMN